MTFVLLHILQPQDHSPLEETAALFCDRFTNPRLRVLSPEPELDTSTYLAQTWTLVATITDGRNELPIPWIQGDRGKKIHRRARPGFLGSEGSSVPSRIDTALMGYR